LKSSKRWVLKSQQMFGANKAKSGRSIAKANMGKGGIGDGASGGFGGHFRAVQGFKYIGDR
jgi:hypothetical protein